MVSLITTHLSKLFSEQPEDELLPNSRVSLQDPYLSTKQNLVIAICLSKYQKHFKRVSGYLF